MTFQANGYSGEALAFAWFESGLFYGNEVRTFLGIGQTGWVVLSAVALSGARPAGEQHTAR